MTTSLPIRPLTCVDEFEACVVLQSQIWGFADRDLVPRRMFVVAHKTGGQVLGAWDGDRLVGFGMALPGHRGGQLYWHSHMLGVASGYRNLGLGRQLKLRQREEALAQKIERMEWTFDPLEIKNGYFNMAVLGAIARQYHPNLYGFTSSALQAGLPTDRLTAEWRLRRPLPSPDDADAATIQTAVEVPAEIQAWKSAGDPRAIEAQTKIREALCAAFARGQAVIGYRREPAPAFLLGAFKEES